MCSPQHRYKNQNHENLFCRIGQEIYNCESLYQHNFDTIIILICVQGQWFSGGDNRVYLLGNPVSSETTAYITTSVTKKDLLCMNFLPIPQ